MSATTKGQKRKSADGTNIAANKKVKIQSSANKPAPLKSALKKSKVATVEPTLETKPTKIVRSEKKIGPSVEEEIVIDKKSRNKAAKGKALTKPKASEAVEVEEAIEEHADAVSGTELSEDQTAALLAGFSSSEESDAEVEDDGIALSKLPKPPVSSTVQSEIAAATPIDPETTPGIIYIGRIPHGFYEPQMRAYFSQFGEVTNLRLARNKKTGKTQHYAFLEFASAAVAEIVAKTMDKYLMFGHILQVRTVPRESVGAGVWRGANKRFKVMPRNRIEGGRLRRGMDREKWEKRIEKENKRRTEKAEKLQEMGYDFEMPDVTSVNAVPVKAATAEIEAPSKEDVEELVESITAPEQALGDVPVVVEETVTEKPGSVQITETIRPKKRSSADGVKKIKKAKRVKTSA